MSLAYAGVAQLALLPFAHICPAGQGPAPAAPASPHAAAPAPPVQTLAGLQLAGNVSGPEHLVPQIRHSAGFVQPRSQPGGFAGSGMVVSGALQDFVQAWQVAAVAATFEPAPHVALRLAGSQ